MLRHLFVIQKITLKNIMVMLRGLWLLCPWYNINYSIVSNTGAKFFLPFRVMAKIVLFSVITPSPHLRTVPCCLRAQSIILSSFCIHKWISPMASREYVQVMHFVIQCFCVCSTAVGIQVPWRSCVRSCPESLSPWFDYRTTENFLMAIYVYFYAWLIKNLLPRLFGYYRHPC